MTIISAAFIVNIIIIILIIVVIIIYAFLSRYGVVTSD